MAEEKKDETYFRAVEIRDMLEMVERECKRVDGLQEIFNSTLFRSAEDDAEDVIDKLTLAEAFLKMDIHKAGLSFLIALYTSLCGNEDVVYDTLDKLLYSESESKWLASYFVERWGDECYPDYDYYKSQGRMPNSYIRLMLEDTGTNTKARLVVISLAEKGMFSGNSANIENNIMTSEYVREEKQDTDDARPNIDNMHFFMEVFRNSQHEEVLSLMRRGLIDRNGNSSLSRLSRNRMYEKRLWKNIREYTGY